VKEEQIRRIVKILEESNVDEIEIRYLWWKIRVSKSRGVSTMPVSKSVADPNPETVAPASIDERSDVEKPDSGEKLHEIKSPMVGTFYRAPSPGADPYVEVGDHVSAGQTICIIEAMKLMNEIESDVSGTVVDILVENAQPVEYNQTLFLIKPD